MNNRKWVPRDILSVGRRGSVENAVNDYEIVYDDEESPKKNEMMSEYSKEMLEQDLEYVDDNQHIENKEDKDKIASLNKVAKVIEGNVLNELIFDNEKKYIIDYENELNKEQLMAVACVDKPLLVIAGAGSGKTRVITYKVAYLIEQGINPSSIVLLSFTRKASQEMLARAKNLLQNSYADTVRGGTFHSFANNTLRRYGKLLGIPSNFTIIDVKDSEDIVDLQRQELGIKTDHKGGVKFPTKSTIYKIISRSRNTEKTIEQTILSFFTHLEPFVEEVDEVYKGFQKYKKSRNLMDYDDLLDEFRNGLKDNSQFRSLVQKSIEYVLVDEYQDTNNAQREIVELVVGDRSCVTVVGDDAQSIYGFRGSNYENILRFPESFKDFRCVKIEENYRSGKEVLDFTNEIIYNSRVGLKKNLRSKNITGKLPAIQRFEDTQDEAEFIAQKILEIKEKEDLSYSDFAVLTRTSWVSGYTQAELLKNKIPFIVVGGIKFNEKRHIRDMVAFLRIAINHTDDISWHRVLQILGGIGKVRSSEIVSTIATNMGEINFDSFKEKPFYKDIQEYEILYKELDSSDLSPADMIRKIVPIYTEHLKEIEDDVVVRSRDLDTLVNIAESYSSLRSFLSSFVLEPPSDRFNEDTTPDIADQDRRDAVVVSTIHSAKGLEWHTVFLPVLLDGVLPSERSMHRIEEVEEERRLFYVASSRVKNNLFITMPEYLSSWDKVYSQPSRFLREINKKRYII